MASEGRIERGQLAGREYTVQRVRFPNSANAAAVVANADGSYTVYLNTRLSEPELEAALRHELRHLEQDDFNSALPIAELEARAGAVSLPSASGRVVPYFSSEAALAEWIYCQKVIENLNL